MSDADAPVNAAAETTHDQSSGLTPHELEATRQSGPEGPEVIGVRAGMFGAKQGSDTTGYSGLRREIVIAGAAERP
jgi:NADH-quinone oxidoreductase subunit C